MVAPKNSSIFSNDTSAIDPGLSALFASSAGPVTVPPRSRYSASKIPRTNAVNIPGAGRGSGSREEAEVNQDLDATDDSETSEDVHTEVDEPDSDAAKESGDLEESSGELAGSGVDDLVPVKEEAVKSRRKRKRDHDVEDLEEQYLKRAARQEEKAQDQARRVEIEEHKNSADPVLESEQDGTSEDESIADAQPVHETVSGHDDPELNKANRTVFLGNVSTTAISAKTDYKTLKTHLTTFFSEIPSSQSTVSSKLESLRFRSTAFASSLPRKAAFVTQDLMSSTTVSTNAYVVYNTERAAREATARLNGTVVLGRHLRVDSVAHPRQVDHKRCVFVGNLDYVDDDSAIRQADVENRPGSKKTTKVKSRPSADVEEGLWREFGKCGVVENVRVVRDAKTRVGKGFAYVQFIDANSVEAALLFNDKKFPPLLPRKLRVSRAKSIKRNAKGPSGHPTTRSVRDREHGMFAPKMSAEERSLQGRSGKLLGRAGAAQIRRGRSLNKGPANAVKKPEDFIFEGHRASSKQGNSGLKLGRVGKKKAVSRSRKRAQAWKASGGKS